MLLILFGFLSGILGGMGVGGGTLLIPALTLLLGFEQKTAQLTNLICFIPTAAAALFRHAKNKKVEKSVLKPFVFWGIAGCAAGSFAALRLGNAVLKKLFGIFLLLMGIREVITGKKSNSSATSLIRCIKTKETR